MINHDILYKAYKRLEKNPDDTLTDLEMYHSSVGYAVAAVKEKFGITYKYLDMARLMVEEGLLFNGEPVRLENLVINLDKGATV